MKRIFPLALIALGALLGLAVLPQLFLRIQSNARVPMNLPEQLRDKTLQQMLEVYS